MKKFLLCLFVLLSFSIFAEKITTDGKPHFDKIVRCSKINKTITKAIKN